MLLQKGASYEDSILIDCMKYKIIDSDHYLLALVVVGLPLVVV